MTEEVHFTSLEKQVLILLECTPEFQSVNALAVATGFTPQIVGHHAAQMVHLGLLIRHIQSHPKQICFYKLSESGIRLKQEAEK